MKVSISKESKKIISLEEAPIAKAIVDSFSDDSCSVAEYARMAVNVACSRRESCLKVFEATAIVSRNCRAWDRIIDGSKDLDVWIEATAQTTDGFYIIGAYISDIWEITGDNKEEIRNRMFIQHFTKE